MCPNEDGSETEAERLARENLEAAEKERQVRTGAAAKPMLPSKHSQEEISEKQKHERIEAVKNLLTNNGANAQAAGSIIDSLDHLNRFNEQSLAWYGIFETLEAIAKLIFNVEYFMQARDYKKAPDELKYIPGVTKIYKVDANGKEILDDSGHKIQLDPMGPGYGKFGSQITRRDIILNGYYPTQNFADAFMDELNQYTNKITGMGLPTSRTLLDKHVATRGQEIPKESGARDDRILVAQQAADAARRAAAAKP